MIFSLYQLIQSFNGKLYLIMIKPTETLSVKND